MENMTPAQEAKSLGNAKFSEGAYKESIEYFTEAIKHSPADHVLFSNRSGSYAMLENYKMALEDAEECIKLNPKWPKGYSRKGLALFKLKRVQEANEAYNEGLKLDPNNTQLKESAAQCRQNPLGSVMKDRFKSQVATLMTDPKYKAYADTDPGFPDKVLNSLLTILEDPAKLMQQGGAMSYTGTDDPVREAVMKVLTGGDGAFDEQDEEDMIRERERRAKNAKQKKEEEERKAKLAERSASDLESEALKQRGNELYKEHKFDEAIEHYDKAIHIKPNDVLIHNNKAAVYIEKGEYEKCLEICQSVITNRYEMKADYLSVAKVYNRMAVCYKKMGDYKQCIAMYEKSLMEDNNRHVRAALKETERAMEKHERDSYIDVNKAEEHKQTGNELFKMGSYPAAKKEYDEAVKRNPQDAKLYSNRAAALCKLLEYPSALKDVEKALELDPVFVKAWSRKGTIHTFMKAYTKAQAAYQRGLAIEPDNLECRRGLEETMRKIVETQSTNQVDEEQLKQAMSDPEVQHVLSDPQFRIILDQISQNPNLLSDFLKDPKIAQGLQKLISAGIVRIQ